MPKYVIERTIPSIGKFSPKELSALSARSCRVICELGPQIQWVQSYIVDDKSYCVYIAPSPELIREHGLRGSFPIDSIREVETIIDPTTAA